MQTMYPAKVNSPVTDISASITVTDTTITVADGSALPDAPNLATIGAGDGAETILYTSKTGNTLSGVARGFQGTARAWIAGTKIARRFTAYDHDAFKSNIDQLADDIDNIDLSADKISLDSPNFSATNVKDGLDELFTSGSEFKSDVAGAITAKGQPTAPTDNKQTFVDNINAIDTDPSGDATALASDLLSGKTAYVQKQKIVGTMPNRTGHVTGQSISRSGTTLRIRPPQGSYPGTTTNSVQWNDANFTAENIKEGVEMFGLMGEFEGGTHTLLNVPIQPFVFNDDSITIDLPGLIFTSDISMWIQGYINHTTDNYGINLFWSNQWAITNTQSMTYRVNREFSTANKTVTFTKPTGVGGTSWSISGKILYQKEI